MSIPAHLQILQPSELEALKKLQDELPKILEKTDYNEMYGHKLSEAEDGPGKAYSEVKRDIILLKFLKARDYDIAQTKDMLTDALKWRKEFDPLDCASAKHDSKFDKLGVITDKGAGGEPQVTNWNLYGAVSNRKEIFGDLKGFLRWRVGIMERSLALLDFTKPGAGSMLLQIHDYKNVSFLRLDAETKAASKETIRVFQSYYPETLERKFFVNVPTLMQFVFGFVNKFLSRETVAKFVVYSNGKDLHKSLGSWVPAEYGGKGGPLLEMAISDHPVQEAETKETKEKEKEKETEKPVGTSETDTVGDAAEPAPTEPAAETVPTTEPAAEPAPTESSTAPSAEPAAETAEPVSEGAKVAAQ
ncbi:Phosphatidylinositol transfer protein SFH5 [Yarrowia lipolytica]|nr:Phosphatidylinositol transfer protein SFH5 [Yarrowia lipolytica]